MDLAASGLEPVNPFEAALGVLKLELPLDEVIRRGREDEIVAERRTTDRSGAPTTHDHP